jgi:hypothetical protein
MKKRIIVLVGIVVIVCVWWYLQNKSTQPPESPSTQSVEVDQQAQPQPGRPTTTQPQLVQPMSDIESEAYGRKAIAEQADRKREFEQKWKAQLSAPINFFGKVIDGNNQPIGGATVEFTWNDLPPESETASYTGETFTPFAYMHSSKSQTTSDAQGLFSLVDKKGKGLSVTINKEGYYPTATARQSFEFGDPLIGVFVPDRFNPVVFRLRKRGPGTDLITSQYGVKDYLGVPVPLDGSSVQVDLLERKTGQGELKISQIKPPYENWKQATEWVFRMEIPGGGFVECEDEFPFEAPEAGYKPSLAFKFRAGETNWMTNLSKDYYIKFGNPVRYGRLHLETSIMMSGARLTYAINPDGSRYLEPK